MLIAMPGRELPLAAYDIWACDSIRGIRLLSNRLSHEETYITCLRPSDNSQHYDLDLVIYYVAAKLIIE